MGLRKIFVPEVYGIKPSQQLCIRKPAKYEHRSYPNEMMKRRKCFSSNIHLKLIKIKYNLILFA